MPDVAFSEHQCSVMTEGEISSVKDPTAEIYPVKTSGREKRVATAILEAARSEAACMGGAQLLRIGVNVGADCNINLELLSRAIKNTLNGSDLDGITVQILSRPRVYSCGHCGSEISSSSSLLHCSNCKSSDIELIGGDDLELAFLEMARN